MWKTARVACVLLAIAPVISALAGSAVAQSSKPYAPKLSQDGKDVTWVPTSQELVARMLALARVTAQDHVIDLGSGDGRLVIEAAKLGARAHGIEYDARLVELSQQNAAKEKLGERATFAKADIFASDFSQATVITMFLLPELNRRLRPNLLALKPGTRIVTNTFDMADWKRDATIEIGMGCMSYCKAHLWIVPATVGGRWQLTREAEKAGTRRVDLALAQKFQMLSGSALADGAPAAKGGKKRAAGDKVEGNVIGSEVTFVFGDARYDGTLKGDTMSGIFYGPVVDGTWQAKRAQAGGAK